METVEIGKAVNTHGIRGEIKVEWWCDSPDVFCGLERLYLADGTGFDVVSSRIHKNHIIVKLKGVDTVEQAETFRNKILFADADDFELDDGVFFIKDIIGIEVSDADTGEVYGSITEVLQNGAKDVYVIKSESREYLIPAVEECVISTDIQNKKMLIRPLEGLFD